VVDPKVDLPIGIIGTLMLTTGLYVGASAVVTGMVQWYALDPHTPLASAFQTVHVGWATTIIAICTVTGVCGVVVCCLWLGLFES
jgi:APA family basic amino acid/polyamine antiporter